MANQVEPGTMSGALPEGAHAGVAASGSPQAQVTSYQPGGAAMTIAGHAGPYPSFHGRKVSWIAVSLLMVGFLVGGLAMVLGAGGPIWWLFWTSIGVAVLGLLIAAATNIFEDWY
jgi:hypothetical protein